MPDRGLPSGTVTFLFTDIEGSTRIIQALGDRYPAILVEHRAIVEAPIRDHGGHVFGYDGDAIFAVFERATPAIEAAAEAQRGLASHDWPPETPIRIRIGIHSGPIERLADDYVGLTLHQVARIAGAGHGGQVLVSEASQALARDGLPAGLELRDLGSHRLKDLAHPERLYQLAGPDLEDTFPELKTLDARPNNLPVQVTSFIGRDELELGRSLLLTSRLVTLTGPGGTGKTRLALQLAAESADAYPDGVFFVALEAVTDPELVAPAIVAALRLDPGSVPPLDHLLEVLPARRMLLVLDNLEQVVAGAPVIGRLLATAPHLTVLATSRIVLRLAGETELPVPPLGLPVDPGDGDGAAADVAAGSEAVRLFVERAMAASPSFRLTDEAAPDVVEIVRRLDGLPLAIELAAARIRMLPLPGLRSRLDHRLAVLVGGPRDRPERQQTLRGAIDWSHDLLDEPGRRLFRRCGVFAGGIELDAAEAVVGPPEQIGGDVLEGLSTLAEQSLLRPAPVSDEPRFQMLVTIREYALERLAESGDEEEIRRRHAAALLALVEQSAGELTGRGSRPVLDRLERQHDDLRAAIDWAVDRDEADIALRLVAGLWRFWQIRGHLIEGTAQVERALALPAAATASAAVRARAYGAAGGLAYWRGDFPATSRAYVTALEEARRSGDQRVLADALYDHGFAPFAEEPSATMMYEAARPSFEEAAAIYRELGDERGLASVEWGLGTGAAYAQQFDEARSHAEAALRGSRAIGDRFGEGWALHMLGFIEARMGHARAADARFREAISVFVEADDMSAFVVILVDFVTVAEQLGLRERAARLGGAATAFRRRSGSDLIAASGAAIDWPVPVRPTDDPEAERWWGEGEEMTVEAAVALALEPLPNVAEAGA